MHAFRQDVRHALRILRRSPGFTITAIAIIAIGIGATTSVFSLANALLLRPLPVHDPERLVNVHGNAESEGDFRGFSYPAYLEMRDGNNVLDGLAAATERSVSIRTPGKAELALANFASGNYFSVLGVRPTLGRFFAPEEALDDVAIPVAVISDNLWRRRFGADPHVLGTNVLVNGQRFTVIGVAPEGFTGTFIGVPFDLWVPLAILPRVMPPANALIDRGTARGVEVFGRLRPDMTLDRAEARMTALARSSAAQFPAGQENTEIVLRTTSGIDDSIRGAVIGFTGFLLFVALLVLLIASTNVAGLLVTRALGRSREMAVRQALGAGRWRLVRLTLVETLTLFVPACLAGLLLAQWATGLLLRFRPPFDIRIALDLGLDWRVVAFTVSVTLLASVFAGAAPALRSAAADPARELRGGGGAGVRRPRLQRFFVIGQISASAVLLIAAGLFVRVLQRAATDDPGFETRDVYTVPLNLTVGGYDEDRGRDLLERVLQSISALPGVASTTMITRVPLGLSRSTTHLRDPRFATTDSLPADAADVAPDYFGTMRISLVAGRDFHRLDDAGAPAVAIVNETTSRRLWPGVSALGRRVVIGGVEAEVIGVAKNASYRRIGELPRLFVYRPLRQRYAPLVSIVVRGRPGSTELASSLQREIARLAPVLPVPAVVPMRRHIANALFPQRIAAGVTGALGIIGLLLAAIGLYGIIAYSVSSRTREIALRVALGAKRSNVMGLVLREGLGLTLVGSLAGVAIALVVTRGLVSLLQGVSAADPLTLAAVPVALLLTAFLAAGIPAMRALGIAPARVLRGD